MFKKLQQIEWTPERKFIRSVAIFALIAVLLMAASWLVGGYVPKVTADNCTKVANTARDVISGCESELLPIKLSTLGVAMLLTLAMLPFVKTLMGFERMNLLRGQIMEKDFNNSAPWMIGGMYLSMLWITINTPYASVPGFLVYLAFAIGSFILYAIAGAVFLIVLFAGVYKVEKILSDFADPGSDAVAMMIFFAMLGAAFLA